jgi:hypothetical protein
VTSDRGHSNMFLIHESDNVISHFLRKDSMKTTI